MFSRFRVGDYVSLTIVGGLFFLQQPIAFCEPPPTQTLEFPDGFRGWAVIVWGQRGYPSLVSKGRDLLIRFPADGILITSTASPMKNSQVIEHHGSSTSVQTNIQGGEPFRQDSFYIDSIGRRVSPNSILRVERFEGMVGKPGLSNTLLLVGLARQQAPNSSKKVGRRSLKPFRVCIVRIGRNPVVKSISLGAVVSAAFLIFADSVCAADARVKVALLDGAPVYHWRVFKSRYSDDIDRALVLREFKRRGFTLPDKFVEKALQQEIAEKYNGDKTNLERSLQRAGMTMVITGNSSPRNSCYRLCPYLSRSTRTATIRPLRGQNGLLRYAKGQTSKYYDDKCIVESVA